MENYLLGLDNGGTMVKAVIFDGNGKEVAGAAAKLRMITPEASMTERDMEELWAVSYTHLNCIVFRVVLAAAFNHFWGLTGIYLACMIAPASSVPLGYFYTRSNVWRRSLVQETLPQKERGM